jgi:DNA polymerase-4
MMRTILHADMDAFFAAVEQHDHPAYRGKPVVVGAPPDQRGVVAAASYEARRYGIHSAMPSREAGRRCPHAIFLRVNGARYRDVSHQVFAIFERFTPEIEPLSVDEAFLDVTGVRRLFGSGEEIARRIKAAVREETGLTVSVGVAGNKFLAKLASDLNKPDGLTIVPTSREAIVAFLAPLPVSRIWGVGKVTEQRLAGEGIHRIGQLQALSERALAEITGKHAARHLLRLAFGEDSRELEIEHVEKTMSREHTFTEDCESAETVRGILTGLVEDVGGRLRAAGYYAGQVRLKLRWRGFETITRQRPLDPPLCDDFSLHRAACELLAQEDLTRPVRLVGFGVGRLQTAPQRQLSLFDGPGAPSPKREALSRTVDRIRQEHGRSSIGLRAATEEDTSA